MQGLKSSAAIMRSEVRCLDKLIAVRHRQLEVEIVPSALQVPF